MATAQQLDQLEEKRRGLLKDLEEIDAKMLEIKNKRKDELLAELKELGLDVPQVRTGGKKQQKPRDPNKKCPICGQTGHDGRFHRKETIGKKK